MTLATEISTDPLGRGYRGMTDTELLESLNAINRELDQDINIDAFHSYLLKRGKGLNEPLDDVDRAHALTMGKKMVSRTEELGLAKFVLSDIVTERV